MEFNKKREEIREGIERAIIHGFPNGTGGLYKARFDEKKCISEILASLHSQGCVLRADRELPSCNTADVYGHDMSLIDDCPLIGAGYVAVESLIEEE